MSAHLGEPACIWRDRRDPPPAATGDYWPGDQVTLCTASRVWTITSVHGQEATLTATGIPELVANIGHLDPVEPATEVDGQMSIFDALEAT